MQIYTTIEALNEVFYNSDDKRIRSVIEDYSDVILDISEEEFEGLFDDPLIKLLYKRTAYSCRDLKDFFIDLRDEDLSQFPSDIFLINDDSKYCADKTLQYGVLVISKDDLRPFQTLFNRAQWILKKGDSYKQSISGKQHIGWETWLTKMPLCPINSVIIIDNYILNNNKSVSNICRLLNLLIAGNKLPKYQITIIHKDTKMEITVEKLKKLKADVDKYFDDYVGICIDLTILTHCSPDKFHERYIITNYHLLSTGKGYNKFNEDIVTERNFLRLAGAYDGIGDCGELTLNFMLQDTKFAKDQVQLNLASDNKGSSNLLVGSGKNRLFDNIS